jgi:hypothetical protein
MPQLKRAAVLGKTKKYNTNYQNTNKDVNDLLGLPCPIKENFIKQEIGKKIIIYYKK